MPPTALHALLVAGLASAILAPAEARAARYRIVDLGWAAEPYQINDSGEIAGIVFATSAAEWRDGSWHRMPDSGNFSYARALNKLGEVAGEDSSVPSRWTKAGKETLETPPGAMFVWAYGIAEDGTVVGTSLTPDSHYHCLAWRGTAATDLGTMGAGDQCQAVAIDRQGRIAGQANTKAGTRRSNAFLYENGVFQDLGRLPGRRETTVARMNDRGHIVGASEEPFDRATLVGFLYDGHRLRNLGTLGSGPGQATGINNHDEIVGYCNGADFRDYATLFVGDHWETLESMVDDLGGWELQRAQDINDSGTIVGTGLGPDGLQHGYMLEPVGE